VLAKQRRLREHMNLCIAVAQDEPRNAHAYSVLGYILVTSADSRKRGRS
jgi:hypothetical protein